MQQISVIVPVYNVEPYLRRCVDSILAQTFTDFELILVDDGSPDGCPAICDEYAEKDSRVKVIHKENGGVSSARNAALDVAQGEYVTFIDSDDWVTPVYLEEFSIYDDVDLIYQTGTFCCENGSILFRQEITDKRINKVTDEELAELIRSGPFGYAWGGMYRRSLIEKNHLRFDETLEFMEDLLFAVQYVNRAKTILCENKANYRYIKYESRHTLCSDWSISKVKKALKKVCNEIYKKNKCLQNQLYYYRLNEFYHYKIGNLSFVVSKLLKNIQLLFHMMEDGDFVVCCKQERNLLPDRLLKAVIKQSKFAVLYSCLYYTVKFFAFRAKQKIKRVLKIGEQKCPKSV